MSFSWPWALLALLVIPLVFAVWWLTRRRRRRAAVRVTSVALVRTAPPGRPPWARRIRADQARPGRLGIQVRHGREAEPDPRRRAGAQRLHQVPDGRPAHRPRR